MSSALASFFHHYTLLFNEFYRHRKNKAYFETISNGFLYILPDFETYRRIAASIPGHDAIMALIKINQQQKENLWHELINIHKFSKKERVVLDVEVSPYPTEKVMPLMEKVFRSINDGITFAAVDEHHYTIDFPHLDAFIDYYLTFFLSIQTPNN
jgi:hypothetical protein